MRYCLIFYSPSPSTDDNVKHLILYFISVFTTILLDKTMKGGRDIYIFNKTHKSNHPQNMNIEKFHSMVPSFSSSFSRSAHSFHSIALESI